MLMLLSIDLNATSIVLILGLVVLVAREILENLGWWNHSRQLQEEKEKLRDENRDLSQYNGELRSKISMLEQHDRENMKQIAELKSKVDELQKRDQAAVLEALQQHDRAADARVNKTHELLESIYGELKRRAA